MREEVHGIYYKPFDIIIKHVKFSDKSQKH